MNRLLLILLSAVTQVSTEPIESMTPFLPSLLTLNNGTRITSNIQWPERRTEIQEHLETYIVGTLPQQRPQLFSVRLINSTQFSTANQFFFKLTFNTSSNNSFSYFIELLAPINSKNCPLFLTQWNHRSWAVTGLSRGYCCIIYPGSDVRDVAPTLQQAYPKSSMMLIIARAYVASLTLDIFFQNNTNDLLPKINTSQICITGHSRNGKQSLLAAAIDERFTSVVGSSPGAPIASPYHLSSHNYYGEGVDAGQAGHWWLKSIEKYAAHPEQLPVDGNGVLAMIAPRRAAIANGWTDHEGDINFADECCLRSAMNVYELYNATDNLRIIHRPGDHHGFDDVSTYFDFFDYGFDRLYSSFPLSWSGQTNMNLKTNPFPLNYLTPAGFDWKIWYDTFGKKTPPPPPPPSPPSSLLSSSLLLSSSSSLSSSVSLKRNQNNLKKRISWLLQLDTKPTVFSKGATYGEDSKTGTFRYPSVMMGLDYENWNEKYQITRQPLSFGNYVTGNLYWSSAIQLKNNQPCPVVVWLHPYSYSTGYYSSYIKGGHVVVDLVQKGYCVLAYHQIGMALRLNQGGTNFYARSGFQESLFGRMITDVQAALDVLQCMTIEGRANFTQCGTGSDYNGPYLPFPVEDSPVLDAKHMAVAGYSLGGNVALHAAAMDKRVTHVACFGGFTPYRTDYNNKTTGGLQRLYDFHALLPRLGLFVEKGIMKDSTTTDSTATTTTFGTYTSIPYDYDEMLATLIAPRPILIHTPKNDRDATFQDVNNCLNKAKQIGWKGNDSQYFNHTTTDTYTNMGVDEVQLLLDWLDNVPSRKGIN